MSFLLRLVVAWLINAAALWVCDWIFDGVRIDGWGPLLIAAAVLGVINTILKPVLVLFSIPLIVITLGLFYFALNILMLALAEWIAPDFSIDGFWTYVGAAIVVWLVNWVLYTLLDNLGVP